jgi:hypothetical protein
MVAMLVLQAVISAGGLPKNWISVVACLLVLLAPVVRAQITGKKKVSNQSDLPRFTYSMSGPASDLVQADAATFNVFAAKVKADLDSIFRDYDIEDKATLRSLLSARVNLQQAAGENQRALETIESLGKVAEKPTPSPARTRSRRNDRWLNIQSPSGPPSTLRQYDRVTAKRELFRVPSQVRANAAEGR